MTTAELVRLRLAGSMAAISGLAELLPQLTLASDAIVACLNRGGTVYTAGNGGSAAQALHLAEELIGRYRGNRRPLRAICLNADPTALTCISNDFGFDHVFARQCQALLNPGDALVVFSTSGESRNILLALEIAQTHKCESVAFLGRDGGLAKALCGHAIVVSATDSAFIQDAHQVALHLLCEVIEQAFPARA